MILSIITINYNNADGLQKTIESVICQKNKDIEYIIIDGGSNDGSANIIEQYTDKIDYWVSEPDKGIYNAMNKGIKVAKGEYITFLNSGDILQKDTDFGNAMSYIQGEDIIYFDLEISDALTNTSYIRTYPENFDFLYFILDSIPHAGTFIKKKTLIEYGYYSEDFKIISDWAFFIDAILKYNVSCKHIKETYVTFFSDGISSTPNNQKLIYQEKGEHIALSFPVYYRLYKEWYKNTTELYKLESSFSIKFLKKIGLLRWLKL